MSTPFEIHPYAIEVLRELLATKAGADQSRIDAKFHCVYFKSYFQELDAKTILVENDYIDRDFLEDFAAYYVRCFHPYNRRCTRLHFFSRAFSKEAFTSILEGRPSDLTAELLQDHYLGFVVVKPLPKTVVGRTCLKPYDAEGGRRLYPITRRYSVHLFGIPLKIKSLAFQEQDNVVAACATSALWSAFQGTGKLFQHAIPSPVEITKAASLAAPTRLRHLPNHGLTAEQMAMAIRSVGLEPLFVGTADPFATVSNIYAYLRGAVPVLMLGSLWELDPSLPARFVGKHAVAITGCGKRLGSPTHTGPNAFQSTASYIDRLYAHDDQVGPFARMILDGTNVRQPGGSIQWSLSTAWECPQPGCQVRFVPDNLLIPIYHKIRIPFSAVQEVLVGVDATVELVRVQAGSVLLPSRLTWDIHLEHLSSFKEECLADHSLSSELRRSVLTRALPRFVLRARALCGNAKVCDLLFDATDIEQGEIVVELVKYDAAFAAFMRTFLATPGGQRLIAAKAGAERAILQKLAL